MGALVVMVHPDDVNLADAKALAAEYNAHVVGNEWVPRGQAILTPADTLELRPAPTGGDDSGDEGGSE